MSMYTGMDTGWGVAAMSKDTCVDTGWGAAAMTMYTHMDTGWSVADHCTRETSLTAVLFRPDFNHA